MIHRAIRPVRRQSALSIKTSIAELTSPKADMNLSDKTSVCLIDMRPKLVQVYLVQIDLQDPH